MVKQQVLGRKKSVHFQGIRLCTPAFPLFPCAGSRESWRNDLSLFFHVLMAERMEGVRELSSRHLTGTSTLPAQSKAAVVHGEGTASSSIHLGTDTCWDSPITGQKLRATEENNSPSVVDVVMCHPDSPIEPKDFFSLPPGASERPVHRQHTAASQLSPGVTLAHSKSCPLLRADNIKHLLV